MEEAVPSSNRVAEGPKPVFGHSGCLAAFTLNSTQSKKFKICRKRSNAPIDNPNELILSLIATLFSLFLIFYLNALVLCVQLIF